jgi:hypothetical protein
MAKLVFAFLIVCSSMISFANSAHAEDLSSAYSDPELENRLTTISKYQAKKGETPRSVARFLYGHETWWNKLRADNPKLNLRSPDQKIPENTLLRYRAPEVGSTYLVQKNDWLIRIVQWKYGAAHFWEEVYRKNAHKISNPNLIHPGDILVLSIDGTVKIQQSGQVIMDGVGMQSVEQPQQQSQTQAQAKDQSVAPAENAVQTPLQAPAQDQSQIQSQIQSETPTETRFEENTQRWNFFWWFLLALLLLALLAFISWLVWKKNQSSQRDHSFEQDFVLGGRSQKTFKQKPLKTMKTKSAWISLDSKGSRKGRPAQRKQKNSAVSLDYFRKRRVEIPEIDRDLIHRDQGEPEKPLGYEVITAGSKAKKRS